MRTIKHVFLGGAIVLASVACSKQHESNESVERRDVFKGSDTELDMINTLNDAFAKEHPDVTKFSVEGGGSGTGIESFIKGEILAANASRKMTEDEVEQAVANGLDPVEVIIAVDAIAIITHPKMRVDSLSMVQLRKIYNGTYTNWKEIGGPDQEIHLYGRDDHSGTHNYIQRNVLRGEYAGRMKQLETTEDIINAVKKDPQGIGYVGIGSLTDPEGKPIGDVWATYIYIEGNKAYSPHEQKAIRDGNYPLTRPLFQYYDGIPKGDLKLFLSYALSTEGQELIQSHGYFPINDFHRQINSYNGIMMAEK